MIAVQEVSCGFLPSQAVNTFQKDQGQPKVMAGNDGAYQSENPAWAPDPVLKKPHQSAHRQQVSQHFMLCIIYVVYNLSTVSCLDGLLHYFDSFLATFVYEPFLHHQQTPDPQPSPQDCLAPPLTTGPTPPPTVTATSLQPLETQAKTCKK